MRQSEFTAKQIFNEVKRLTSRVSELEKSIMHLRKLHSDWEDDIENDERLAVKILYDALKDARNDLEHYGSMEVKVHNVLPKNRIESGA